jgi:hypothetical protein
MCPCGHCGKHEAGLRSFMLPIQSFGSTYLQNLWTYAVNLAGVFSDGRFLVSRVVTWKNSLVDVRSLLS